MGIETLLNSGCFIPQYVYPKLISHWPMQMQMNRIHRFTRFLLAKGDWNLSLMLQKKALHQSLPTPPHSFRASQSPVPPILPNWNGMLKPQDCWIDSLSTTPSSLLSQPHCLLSPLPCCLWPPNGTSRCYYWLRSFGHLFMCKLVC